MIHEEPDFSEDKEACGLENIFHIRMNLLLRLLHTYRPAFLVVISMLLNLFFWYLRQALQSFWKEQNPAKKRGNSSHRQRKTI
jgi:hypothetical protein